MTIGVATNVMSASRAGSGEEDRGAALGQLGVMSGDAYASLHASDDRFLRDAGDCALACAPVGTRETAMG